MKQNSSLSKLFSIKSKPKKVSRLSFGKVLGKPPFT